MTSGGMGEGGIGTFVPLKNIVYAPKCPPFLYACSFLPPPPRPIWNPGATTNLSMIF